MLIPFKEIFFPTDNKNRFEFQPGNRNVKDMLAGDDYNVCFQQLSTK